ncbi:CYTH domain-containing protein [Marinobacter maritimus]|uniref:CYTH domain-containing protein n=1 Tax=Marinobacter maritimus TaxID=277961 RepID=UPI0011AA6A67|nr:CYTH domain-containing protein [Marinobacter maritimus]|tara:strand:- start:11 stop:910 length:900 start_codon:yes stop_codon:yes gene_type:complete
MAEELEIKLTLNKSEMDTVLAWLSAQNGATPGSSKLLVNTYYDTPGADLHRQKAALRVRQKGDAFIQTVKTRGRFVNGMHQREEWEWPLSTAALNLGLLAATPLGDSVNLEQLAPVFETNFNRQIVMIDDGDAIIECALDIGVIIAGQQQKPLCEVEFELKSGNPQRLLVWAERLASECPVFVNLISKAEQGYYLAGIRTEKSDAAEKPGVNKGGQDDVDRLLHQLSNAWLEQKDVSLEGLNIQSLQAQAEACGLGQPFSELAEYLSKGGALSHLLRKSELGQCQLGLLINRVKQSLRA